MDPAQTLVVRNMSMTFGGQRALDAVDVSIRRGEIHGLVGQNGVDGSLGLIIGELPHLGAQDVAFAVKNACAARGLVALDAVGRAMALVG